MSNDPTAARRILDNIKNKDSKFWTMEEQKQMLALFHQAAKRVPAYQKFLKKQGIDPSKIKTIVDFKKIPPMDKKNYLRRHDLQDISWDGNLLKPLVYTATSGSTGAPFYFHRSLDLDWQSSVIHELFLTNSSYKNKESILVIDCFGMGVWIGGLITYQAFKHLQERGYPVSVVTPGINKEEIFKILSLLAPKYKQIILIGYPPFLKDVIDEFLTRNIHINKMNLRLLFAAEPFTEKFRDYVTKLVHIHNPLLDTMNIYGSADIGTMAFETPLSIFIRREALKNKKLYQSLFPESNTKLPTLAQYIPDFISFEKEHGELLLTGNNSLPLIRYAIGDCGGVYDWDTVNQKFTAEGLSLSELLAKAGLADYNYQLPFVYIYERVDFSVKLYGATIEPATIRDALLSKSLQKYLTGKFTMSVPHDKKLDQYLEINVELRVGTNQGPQLMKQVSDAIVGNLLKYNAEYRNNHNLIPEKVTPHLVFWPHNNPEYFRAGVKQKWVGV